MKNELGTLRTAYRQDKAAITDGLRTPAASTRGIRAVLQKLSQLTDTHLSAIRQASTLPPEVALVAVGGYGREQLFPASDVDVLLLLPGQSTEAHAHIRETLERFIGACWDAGLEIGSSVRTISECVAEARQDVTVQTSLLEARLIDGDAALFADFRQQFRASLNPKAFFTAKTLELQQRHIKHDGTPYSLEPNCKESPGGLRDLHTILWVAQAAGLGNSWRELAASGIATEFEATQLERNEATLSLIRAKLHALSGRHEDRLIFDLQTAVAESFGIQSHTPAGETMPVRASEVLMRRYYWAAKAVMQLQQILLLNIQEHLYPDNVALKRIDDRFFDKDGLIEVASDDLYQKDPQAILATFLTYQKSPGLRDLSARTLRALYSARDLMDNTFRQDPVNRDTFMQILQEPHGQTHAFRLMNATSVLGRYLWSFRRIVGQMQHDLFHVYTVDQHTLMVLRNMRRFFMAEHAHEYPLCSQLASGWDKPWLLYLAALFHDIGKGRGGDHSEIGAIEVKRFARQHDMASEDAELVEFLVREHLQMSTVAQKQDTSDPNVIAAFAQRVGNERQLTALYLLTVADIRGTSPKVWNAWKGKLLEDLFHNTMHVLGGRAPDAQSLVEARKRDALVQLALSAQPYESQKALWDTLNVSYFMRHEPSDIAWHARQLSRHVGSPVPIVRARQSLAGEGVQVLVYAPDQADLFARICGYFDNAGLTVVDARIHTARNGYALDTFQIASEQLHMHYRELTTLIESGLPQAIQSKAPLPEPIKRRLSRRVRSFPMVPRVTLTPDEKAQSWLLNISASDRAGLLYSVARILGAHGLSVQLAKVTTLGERVEDSFLVQGASLNNNAKQLQIETQLVQMLEE
ncbi:[protein-PII] uridylyltransferase [Comamonas avium]|uniref:Bifunctional uridylyltransferase/uridylyl-removing enzyme n=1 Tax=Comamonas avium TaxID=2762231 RepID=A0ABR8S681_9BURK|nr:[protein-PII] uridylyltransferase [Comamonas avium]MBD7958983.1 [protein-PII] uridylyltransferase [Comamonas avium]